MKDNHAAPRFSPAPKQYDPKYFDTLIRQMTDSFQQTLNQGPINVTQVNIAQLPTSATGLRSGDLYRDGDFVMVVP